MCQKTKRKLKKRKPLFLLTVNIMRGRNDLFVEMKNQIFLTVKKSHDKNDPS